MNCATVINFECSTVVGNTFNGHRFEFDSADVVELTVVFENKYGTKIPALEYTVANGKLLQPDPLVWEMKPFVPDVDPGKYHYDVTVVYANGNVETIITGTKNFIK